MPRLRISDAPLLNSVIGDEKIPTGKYGDYTLTPDMIVGYAQGKLPFATKTELAQVKAQLEASVNTVQTTLSAEISALSTKVDSMESQVLGVSQDLTLHKADISNPHKVTKAQVGLGNVDNTSDLNKPVSTATQSAIDAVKNEKKKASDILDESGLTQQELNNGIESVADLALIKNPKEGTRVYVKSYHAGLNRGGGVFVYSASQVLINNGGTIINGWVRIYNGCIHFDWFGCKADGVNDDWGAINKAIESKASTAYLGDWNATSIRTTGSFEFGTGVYRTTKPILLPPYTRIVGQGNRWYFAGDVTKSNTVIKPDFSNVYQFAFQSANYNTTTGQLIDVNQNYTGGRVDSKEITSTLGIEISKLSIEPTSKILGGIRLVASARSKLRDMHITSVDMGVVMNSSWSSFVDVTTQHDKTGLLIGWSCNNCEVRGYYTGTTNAVLPNNFWCNHLDGAASSYGLSSDATNPELKFGVFGRYNQGTDLPNVTCEGNNYSVACIDGDFVIGAIYSEKSRSATILAYQSQVTIGNTTGGLDASIFDIGHRSDVNLKQYGQLYVNQSTLIKNLSRTKTRLTVPNNFNYIISHVYTQQEVKKIYVDAVNGNDLNVGDFYSPLKTVNSAVQRASFEMGLNDTYDQVAMMREIVIVDSSTHTISTHTTLQGVVRILTTQTTNKPKLLFNAQFILNNCILTIAGVDIERSSVVMPSSQDGCFIASDGVSTLNLISNTNTILSGGLINERYLATGVLNIIARNCIFTGSNTTQIYGRNTGQDTTHLINLVLKGVTYAGGLESLTNRGWNIPAALRGSIVGVTLS